MKKVFILLFVVFSCANDKEEKVETSLKVKEIKSYENYMKEGFSRVPVDIIMLEKKMDDFILDIEFDDSLESVRSKKWVFELDSSHSKNDNLNSLLDKYNLTLASPLLCEQDSIYCYFNVVTDSNIILLGKILTDGYSNEIELNYYHPI